MRSSQPFQGAQSGGLDRAHNDGAGASPIKAQPEVNMPNLTITFYRALIDAKVPEPQAQLVVEAMEAEIAMKIKEATHSIELRINLLIGLTLLSTAIGGYLAAFNP
jgi:hypothetical protein